MYFYNLLCKYQNEISSASILVIALFSIVTFIFSVIIYRTSKQYQDDIKKLIRSIQGAVIVGSQMSGTNMGTDRAIKLLDEFNEKSKD